MQTEQTMVISGGSSSHAWVKAVGVLAASLSALGHSAAHPASIWRGPRECSGIIGEPGIGKSRAKRKARAKAQKHSRRANRG